jgi:hypothetical protein
MKSQNLDKKGSTYQRTSKLILAFLCASYLPLRAQEFKVFNREVQVHGWVSQGFVYTSRNNWLTMNTSSGSGAMTDMGLNMSVQIADNFRVGAQVYNRNLGQLGQYHPSLDWAYADYQFRPWLGFRGGKVKTVLGLYNDTQDLDFLHSFALLPQSVYPIDLRDATIAHTGVDVYGKIPLKHHFGDLAYTAYVGRRSDGIYSGYPYLLTQFGVYFSSYGGLQYGADLRWSTPLRGLLIGVSRLNQSITGKGIAFGFPAEEHSKQDWTNQFYGEFAHRGLQIDVEYRRYLRDQRIINGTAEDEDDVRGWYVSGAYRVRKWLEIGSYYSRYTITSTSSYANLTDTTLPYLHNYDKVVTANFDINRFWNLKIEGHFMDGYGNAPYPNGFYPQVNPQGFQPDTNALVLKTSFKF